PKPPFLLGNGGEDAGIGLPAGGVAGSDHELRGSMGVEEAVPDGSRGRGDFRRLDQSVRGGGSGGGGPDDVPEAKGVGQAGENGGGIAAGRSSMKGAVPHGPAAFPAPCTGISPPSQKRCGSIRGLADSRIEGAEGIGLKEKTGCCILFKETGMSWTEKGEPEFNAPLSTGTAVSAGALRHCSRNPGVETLEIFKTDRLDASLNRKRALLLRSRRMRLSGTGRIKALRKEIWPSSNVAREAGGEGTSVRDGDIFRRDGSPRHRRCQRGDGDLDASAIPASLQRLFTASREKGCLQDPTRRKIRRHAS